MTSPTNNAKLAAWVEEMTALCKPANVHWVNGSQEEYDQLCQTMVDFGHVRPAQSRKAAQLLPRPLASIGRGPRRGPYLHLLGQQGRSRPHQQLGTSRPDARDAPRLLQRLHGRPHALRHPLQHGSHRLAHRQDRHPDHRQPLCRHQHAHHDAHGQRRDRRARPRRLLHPLHALDRRAARPRPDGRAVALRARHSAQIHRALPGNLRNLVLRLRLRRQRAARQEVPGAAHRLGDGARRGLARRAHAHHGR